MNAQQIVLGMNPVVLAFFVKLFLFKDVYNLQKCYVDSCHQSLFPGVL